MLVNRSLSDVANDTSLDGQHMRGRQICALKREHGGAVRRVAFNDVIGYGTAVAHSAIYDTLPKRVVGTSNGTM